MANYYYDEIGNTGFVNPYNFVTIDFNEKETISCQKMLDNKTLHTGFINCSLYTKTPIAIPDTENITQDEQEHKTYTFMKKPNGQYIIPGSSIRGTLRNVFETATDSCFSTMRENTKLNARSKEFAKPGLLMFENGQWKLYEAKRYMLKVKQDNKKSQFNTDVWDIKKCPVYTVHEDSNHCKYILYEDKKIYSGSLVHFKKLLSHNQEVTYQKKLLNDRILHCGVVASKITFDENDLEGYLVIGEYNSSKHHENIFCKQNKTIMGVNIELAIEGMEDTLKVYRNSSINKEYEETHYGYANYETMKQNGCIPVWYIQTGRKFYLQFAAIGRKSFNTALNSLVKRKKPCTSREKLCEACRLFGMIGKEKESNGIVSRIRITDATFEKGTNQIKTLAELGGPRPSYTPFYANVYPSNFTLIDKNGRKKATVPEYDDGIKIRGRKYYWHSKNFDEINRNIKKTKRNSTMELLNNAVFHFQIYFDRITEEELKKLVWSVNFWENDKNGNMCHKIGHGKPIGLGSVKIVIEEIKERTFSPENGYAIHDYIINYDEKEPMTDSITLQELKKICDFRNCMNVSYPYVELPENNKLSREEIEEDNKNALANHKWFTENRSAGLQGHNHNVQILPRIKEENQELNTYVVTVRNWKTK